MKVAHVVPCRDKEDCVAMSVMSVLNQDYSPLHVVISDQGSTDRTLQIIKNLVESYTGPHKVSLLECPVTDPKGMSGMNAHLDWIVDQIDDDYIFLTAASDWAHPERTRKSMAVFEEFSPDMVLNKLQFLEIDGSVAGVSASPPGSGFVSPRTCLDSLVGGSTAHSLTRDFLKACGGFSGVASLDAYLPFLACCRNGAYFLDEVLHAYIRDNNLANTGLEGVWRAAEDSEKGRIEELMHYQVASGYVKAARILDSWGLESPETRQPLYEHLLGRCVSWVDSRTKLTEARINPMPLKA